MRKYGFVSCCSPRGDLCGSAVRCGDQLARVSEDAFNINDGTARHALDASNFELRVLAVLTVSYTVSRKADNQHFNDYLIACIPIVHLCPRIQMTS